MSDIEPEDEGLVENPDPEADAPEEEDAPPESEAGSNIEFQVSEAIGENVNQQELLSENGKAGGANSAESDICEPTNDANENSCLAEGDQAQFRDVTDGSNVNNNGDGGATASNEMQENLEAEDEQYYGANKGVNFAGAEWSLEPEENSQNFAGFIEGEGAEGDVNRGDITEAEQGNDSGCVAAHHRTESSCQLEDSVTEDCGAGSVRENSYCAANDLEIEADGASAVVRENIGNQQGNRLEEDDVANFVAEEENEPTESDDEITSHHCSASGRINDAVNEISSNANAESDTVCIKTENEALTQSSGRDQACANSSSTLEAPIDGRVVLEDEISVVTSAESKTEVAQSFQPECDQSAIATCQSISSQNATGESMDSQNSASSHSVDRQETNTAQVKADHGDNDPECEKSPAVPQAEIEDQKDISPAKHSSTSHQVCSQSVETIVKASSDNVSLDTSVITPLNPDTAIPGAELNLSIETGAIQKHSSKSGKDSRPASIENCTDKVKPSPDKEKQTLTQNVKEQSVSCSKTSENGLTADIDSEEELLSELDATLQNTKADSAAFEKDPENYAISNEQTSADEDNFSCEQCLRNNLQCSLKKNRPVNKDGKTNIPETKDLKRQMHQAKQLLLDRECEISRLKDDLKDHKERMNTLSQERDTCMNDLECLKHQNSDDLYIPQIKELEYTIAQQQNEIRSYKDKLSSHDAAAKRAIGTLQHEMKLRIDQVTKMYEEATREKDSMVVKYAQAEHKNLEFQKQAERAESKLRDMEKERDSFMVKMRAIKDHRTKVGAELDAKISELSNVNKELDKHREMLSSADVRVKWAQNKLKAELDAHKETKAQLEKMNSKIKEAKEETQQIRSDCQAIIKTYQESEEVKSNSLDKELKQKETELLVNLQEKTNFELAHVKTQRELEHVKGELRDSKTQCSSLTERVSSLEMENETLTSTMNKYAEIIQKQKKEVQDLRERIETLVQYRSDFTRAQELIKTLDAEISDLKISNKDLVAEMEACRRRETDKLELTAKLSRKNAELQSENTTLSNKILNMTGELQTTKMDSQSVDTKLKELSDALANEQKLRQEETQSLNTRVAGKSKAVEDLTRKLDEEKDEIKTLKRKHANNVKDLTRQLQQVRRKLENYEASVNGDKDTVSMGSRTSSNGSLNTINIAEQTNTQVVQPSSSSYNSQVANSTHRSSQHEQQEYQVITEQVEVDKQTLIERIVKLQRAMARKSEKLEFMEDHISQLVDEIQKKNKIIQSYILREETGTMTTNSRDVAKPALSYQPSARISAIFHMAEISRKHSIMGSVYSSHSNDGTMTLDLSLEINRKLQAVLEDTLLKNMTLKESLDTLGQEIARLSQENRSLQLQMQAKGRLRGNPAHR